MKPDARDVLTTVGLAMVGAGLAMIHLSLALIVIGALIFLAGVRPASWGR